VKAIPDYLIHKVKAHIRDEYRNIFSEKMVESHFNNYILTDLSLAQLKITRDTTGIKSGQRLCDLGCGYGTFVLVCRQTCIDATGVDLAEYQIKFGRKRMKYELPNDNISAAYQFGDARNTGMPEKSFDVVSAWNVLEHIKDYDKVIQEAYRLLKPGGYFVGIAPNYCAFRNEAHYQVPWLPLLPRRLAKFYLQILGKRADFFENEIHYVTNWGILKKLRKNGFKNQYYEVLKTGNLDNINSTKIKRILKAFSDLHLLFLINFAFLLMNWNPFKPSILFIGQKTYE